MSTPTFIWDLWSGGNGGGETLGLAGALVSRDSPWHGQAGGLEFRGPAPAPRPALAHGAVA